MADTVSSGSSDQVFDPWLAAEKWDATVITFSFPEDGSYYSYQPDRRVLELNEAQKQAARDALDLIASYTGLEFQEVDETASTQATLRFASERGLGGGYAYLPSQAEEGGDAFFGTAATDPVLGSEAFVFFTHEIGHALGLEHGHEFPEFADGPYNSQEFTIMTYTDYIGDTDTDSYDSGPVDWAQSYMQLDIAALQFLYGANYADTGEVWSGDTVYAFDPDTGEMFINGQGQGAPVGNRIFMTIWDGHGTDSYDLSMYETDLAVDLAPGAFSLFSEEQLADLNDNSSDPAYLARGNLANALLVDGDERSLIENVIGGAGDDVILGNSAENELAGKEGDDRVEGGKGADILKGGRGRDVIEGEKGKDAITGGKGADTLRGGGGDDRIEGGAGGDKLKGGDGADVFVYSEAEDADLDGRSERIVDFESGTDQIDLSALVDGDFVLRLDRSLNGNGPQVASSVVAGDTLLEIDLDGDGAADMEIFLFDITALDAGDFLL